VLVVVHCYLAIYVLSNELMAPLIPRGWCFKVTKYPISNQNFTVISDGVHFHVTRFTLMITKIRT